MLFRLIAAAMILSAGSAAAQIAPALTRLEPGTCPTCTISLEKVAVVGSAEDAELLSEYNRLLQLPDGGYLVAPTSGELGQLLRYDRSGKYLGTLGKIGDGPGEYRSIQSMVFARGDSVSLMGGRRITTISLASGRGRSEPVTLQAFYHQVLSDGRVIVNSMAQGEPRFALLTPTSQLTSRFGPEPPMVVLPRQNGRTIGDSYGNLVAMAPSPSGGFWVGATYYGHRLQKLTSTGQVLFETARKPAWFAPYAYADIDERLYRLGELRTPRPTIMNAVGVTSSGHVLTLSRTADAKWKADPKAPPPNPPGGEYPVERLVPTGGIDRYVDSVLELYRESDGAFLGSWRSDTVLGQMTPNGLIYLKGEDADGVASYTVYRVKITGGR
jgi:hypothetical protein